MDGELVIFFSGWATDSNIVKAIENKKDMLFCSNYRFQDGNRNFLDQPITFDTSFISANGGEIVYFSTAQDFEKFVVESNYTNLKIIAWSLGVYIANSLDFLKRVIDFWKRKKGSVNTVAVNGTSCPIDDYKGIPLNVFEGTLNNLSERNIYKFRRRMCGKEFELFMKNEPQRDFKSCKDELAFFWDYIKRECDENREKGAILNWDCAYICRDDKIFPFDNQLRAWEGVRVEPFEGEHFSAELFFKLFALQ